MEMPNNEFARWPLDLSPQARLSRTGLHLQVAYGMFAGQYAYHHEWAI